MFSEISEREKRFFVALRISFPFILVLVGCAYLLASVEFTTLDRILFLILVVCYIYYVIYLLYYAFSTTILDDKTNTFTRKEILSRIEKELKKNPNSNVVLINIFNIQDISQRYGYKNGDSIIKDFIKEFNLYFEEKGFDKIPIGRYFGANFLSVIDCKTPQLEHYLKSFEREVNNKSINNIEIKMKFSTIEGTYDRNLENLINVLFLNLNSDEKPDITLKPNTDNELICYAIDQGNFEIKIQDIMPFDNANKPFYATTVKLVSNELGNITKTRVLAVASVNNYETKYDLQVLRYIAKTVGFDKMRRKILIEISPISLRNVEFANEIRAMIAEKVIDPKKIIFELFEDEAHGEIKRFAEIVEQFRQMGFSFALNKFGGNNASIEYLKHLPIDYVIFDIEFNKNYEDERIRSFYLNLGHIAQTFGARTMVRFVDKPRFFESVKEFGIDYAQGFIIDKPQNITKLKD